MALASLQDIEHEFGKVQLLRGLNLEINPGERIALVGANGSGKTTVFRVLTRRLKPTAGFVNWGKNLRIGYLPQQPKMETDDTVRQVARRPFADLMRVEQRMHVLSTEMASAKGDSLGRLMKEYSRLEAEHAAAGGFAWEHRVEEVLAGVGFLPDDLEKPCRVLSGGQQCRLALASILLEGADLLLLDEPTNHLDLEAVQWLEKYLQKLTSAVLLVSHDRYLLDRVATKVYELAGGQTEMYPGNYTNYVRERDVRRLHRRRQFEKDQEFIAKERSFIDRFRTGSRSKEARGRAKRLERRLKGGEFLTEDISEQRTLSLKIAAGSRGSRQALRMENVAKAFGDERIVADLSLKLTGGQKLAILGGNGVGKTTVLRMALGEEEPDSGTVRIGEGMTVGYYDQKQHGLDDSLTVLGQMQSFTGVLEEAPLRSFLARFLLTGETVWKAVGSLSGGERSRLLLARLLFEKPNFLVLDEPTNHLDIPSCEMLEQALCEYDGTILLVSHDRYFVDKVCDRMLLMWRGRYELIDGDYSYWRRREEEKAAEGAAAPVEPDKPTAKPVAAKAKAVARKTPTKVGGLNSYQMSKLTVADVEQHIHQHEQRLIETEKSFSDPAVFSEAAKLADAQQAYDDIRLQIEALMEVWQAKMEQES